MITELAERVPIQKAGAKFGHTILISDGESVFHLPDKMTQKETAMNFLKTISGQLVFTTPLSPAGDNQNIFYIGTVAEMRELLPDLARHSALADLNDTYPAAGEYVIRVIRRSSAVTLPDR